jgi:hypothetical protein
MERIGAVHFAGLQQGGQCVNRHRNGTPYWNEPLGLDQRGASN